MVQGLSAVPWPSPVEVVVAVGSAGEVSDWSRVLSAVPSRLITAVTSLPPGTAPSGQLSCAVPSPEASVVKVTSVSSPSGPVAVTVYSVSGLRPV